MNNLSQITTVIKKPIVAAAIGFVIGLIIGLPVLGWGLLPVKWTDASPDFLREDLQQDYLEMAIDSYALTGNGDQAKARWAALGENNQDMLQALEQAHILAGRDVANLNAFRGIVQAPLPNETMVPSELTPGAEVGGEIAELSNGLDIKKIGVGLGISCVLVILIGAALFYMFFSRNKKGGLQRPQRSTSDMEETAPLTEYDLDDQDMPVASFITEYNLGDDLYDDSFSIDAPSGEFLGECGVGIMDTIGTGDPKKVSAFEVWLFDKNDIQTVTKVLMSQHANQDPEIRQRLASKGEPLLLEPGCIVELETATLRLTAQVDRMEYGEGALPQESFFDNLRIELAVWPKT
jgi:hypothetical protein